MSVYNKVKGTRFENQIVEWVMDNSMLLRAARLPRAGAKDEGDVEITWPTGVLVIEAKNHKAFSLADWVKQAKDEVVNYVAKRRIREETAFPAVIVKRRQKSIGESYVCMELYAFTELVEYLLRDARE